MNCDRCGFENFFGAKFCSECGAKLLRPCPQCDNLFPYSDEICQNCGHKLRQENKARALGHPGVKPFSTGLHFSHEAVEGERKFITVLFADVVNYTSIAESLDPEDLQGVINDCWKVLMNEIKKYEGTVLQFLGDGMVALFGAPVAQEDHATRACYAALSIQKALLRYSEEVRTKLDISFLMRIGMDSGLVVVTGIGEKSRKEFTAIGYSTNLAARMQSISSPGSIVVSSNTYKLAKDYFDFKPLGKMTVKGKSAPIEAYEVLDVSDVDTRIKVSASRGFSKFVGRQRELDTLKKIFSKTKLDSGQVAWVCGEPGVGKTRLLREFMKYLNTEECTILEGNCQRYGSSVAYLPIIEILKVYFGIIDGTPEGIIKNKMFEKIIGLQATLKDLLPPFYELISLDGENESFSQLDPKLKRDTIFEAIKRLFVEESGRKPIVIIIDDLHWIDKTTEAFFSYLMPYLSKNKIMLVFLSRDADFHDWREKPYYMALPVQQLDSHASKELIESLLKYGDVSGELVDFIGVKTGNNPLFIEELVNALVENGNIGEENGRWVFLENNHEIEVPDTVQGIIASRIDRLGGGLKKMLQYASVIGRNFVYPVLESVLNEENEDISSNLLVLQKQGFIYKNNLFPEIEYAFKHALVQDVAYHSLLMKRRLEIHGMLGSAIENIYHDRLDEFYEVLSHHFKSAGHLQKAFKYLKLSGIKAEKSSALWEAFRFYREAMDVLTMNQDGNRENMARQIEITVLMTSPMISLGFPEDSLEILQRAEKIARTLGDAKSLVTLSSAIGLYYSVKGNPLKGEEYALECLKNAEKTNDLDLMAPIVFDLCSNYTARGEFIKLIELAPRTIKLLEESKRESESFERGYNVYSALLAFYGFSIAWMGSFEEGRKILDKAIMAAGNVQNVYSLGLAEVFYGYSLCYQGYGERAIPHFEMAINYLEKGQIFILLGFAWTGIGYAKFFMGNPDQALSFMEKGLSIHLKAGISYNTSVHFFFLSLVYIELGQLEKGRLYAGEALKYAQENNEVCFIALSRVVLGRIMILRGQSPDIAEQYMLDGFRLLTEVEAKPQQAITYLALAEVSLAKNELKKGIQYLWSAHRLFKKMKMDFWISKIAPLELMKEILKKDKTKR